MSLTLLHLERPVFALGLVLLVLSGVFTLGVVLSNTDPVSASAFGVSLTNVSLGGLFLAGAIAGLIFGLSLALMIAGAARKRSRRVQTKRTVKGVRSEKEELAAENDRLRSELSTRPSGTGSTAAFPADAPVEEKHGLFRR